MEHDEPFDWPVLSFVAGLESTAAPCDDDVVNNNADDDDDEDKEEG